MALLTTKGTNFTGMGAWLLVLILSAAAVFLPCCGTSTDDSLQVRIVSPSSGAVFSTGDNITLVFEGSGGGSQYDLFGWYYIWYQDTPGYSGVCYECNRGYDYPMGEDRRIPRNKRITWNIGRIVIPGSYTLEAAVGIRENSSKISRMQVDQISIEVR